jgi:putative transposase
MQREPAVKKGPDVQGLGRSRGGLGTKLQAAVDALGNPVRLLAGPGQQNDMAQAHNLIVGLHAEHVIADRAYEPDGHHF